jgi:hypothetical protein
MSDTQSPPVMKESLSLFRGLPASACHSEVAKRPKNLPRVAMVVVSLGRGKVLRSQRSLRMTAMPACPQRCHVDAPADAGEIATVRSLRPGASR